MPALRRHFLSSTKFAFVKDPGSSFRFRPGLPKMDAGVSCVSPGFAKIEICIMRPFNGNPGENRVECPVSPGSVLWNLYDATTPAATPATPFEFSYGKVHYPELTMIPCLIITFVLLTTSCSK